MMWMKMMVKTRQTDDELLNIRFCWCRCCSQFGVVFFMFYVARLTFCLDIKTCFGRPVVDLGMSQRPLNPRFFQPRCWMVVAKDSGQSENCSYVVCKMCHHESWWYKYIDDVIPCWRTCGFELYRMYTQSLLAASVFSSRLPATRRYQKIQGRL